MLLDQHFDTPSQSMFDELDRVTICPEKVIHHKALKLHTCITTLILIRAMVKLVLCIYVMRSIWLRSLGTYLAYVPKTKATVFRVALFVLALKFGAIFLVYIYIYVWKIVHKDY